MNIKRFDRLYFALAAVCVPVSMALDYIVNGI
jgi:hypothetical protein